MDHISSRIKRNHSFTACEELLSEQLWRFFEIFKRSPNDVGKFRHLYHAHTDTMVGNHLGYQTHITQFIDCSTVAVACELLVQYNPLHMRFEPAAVHTYLIGYCQEVIMTVSDEHWSPSRAISVEWWVIDKVNCIQTFAALIEKWACGLNMNCVLRIFIISDMSLY